MICFLCATPYHIILSLIIKSTLKNCKADMIIYNHFSNASKIYTRLCSAKKFSDIYFIDENSYGLERRIKRGIHIFYPEKTIKHIANNKNYQQIIFFTLDFLNIAYIIKMYNKRKISCDFCYGEDGIGTYIDKTTYIPQKFTNFLLCITNRKKYLIQIKSLLLLEPRLLQCNFLKNIIKIKNDNIYKELLFCRTCIWPEAENINLNTVLYLQQPFEGNTKSKIFQVEKNIYQICQNIFRNQFLIKLHPRTKDYPSDAGQIINVNIPFECLIPDTENYVIISFASTAAFTPAMLYKRKPYIIFLYKLISKSNFIQDKVFQDFLNAFKNKLNYGDRIFIPLNMSEFRDILLLLKSKKFYI